jgi:SPP1 family phage portal protein
MTTDQIKKYVDKIQSNAGRYKDQKAYAIGNNVSIYRPLPKSSPDNRKPIPFARRAVAMIKGYMAKPGNIVYTGEYYTSTLAEIYNANDEEIITANEFEDALVHGSCYELHWMTEGVKYFYPVPVEQGCPVYSDDLKPKLIAFVWHRVLEDETEIATCYDDTYAQDFVYSSQAGKKTWIAQEPQPHGYGVVPVNVGQIDRDKRNLFDHVLPLIDLYDKLMSEDIGNELERFNAAIMLMANRIDATSTDETGRTMVDRLKELRLLDGVAEDGTDVRNKVAFVGRDIPTAFISFASTQIERLIYEMLMIVNPNDDNFATASGVAQAYKLLGMEYLCASIESYFGMFLQNRIKIISGIDSTINGTSGVNDVSISFKRNLPHNLTEIADNIAKLTGLVSTETLLKMLPTSVVPDIEEELERIEASKPETPFSAPEIADQDEDEYEAQP